MSRTGEKETGVATTEVDPNEVVGRLILDPEARANPYPTYDQIRDIGGIYAEDIGIWMVASYAHCDHVMRHHSLVRKHKDSWQRFGEINGATGRLWYEERARSMLWLDPPDHGRIRGLVSKAFTPRYLARLRPRIVEIVDELISAIEKRGEADIINDLALPLPMRVICDMLGVPSADRDDFRRWTTALAATLEPLPSPEVQDAADDAARGFDAYFRDLIERRRDDPGEDLLSRLIQAEQAGDQLTEEEVISTAMLLLGAGFETTTNLIGNGTLALLTHREQWEALVRDPSLAPHAVEELLRYDSPVQMATPRVARETFDVDGLHINEGDIVLPVVGGGNRDPERFEGPNSLDIDRKEPAPLSFGGGPHFCLGAALARIEGAEVFAAMATRLPGLELSEPSPKWRPLFNLRGLEELPVATGN